ncbi:MAG TPA: ADOP family duplicated permease [Gemmatimonadaceae bacterium]|nr:ADOP family duplicated permease [Gemmatimonadaceae bacterium]
MSAPLPRPEPPRLARWLISRFARVEIREALLGDLEETFQAELQSERGERAARRWYWREALRAAIALSVPLRSSSHTVERQGDGMVSTTLADLRFAARLFARRPGFTLVTVMTLAVGIGATTTIFSAVNPILFQSLPYPHADRLVMVWEREATGERSNLGYATYLDLAERHRTIESSAALGSWLPTMTGQGVPTRLQGDRVSASYFRVLGIAPALGRDFLSADDDRSAPRVTILSYGLWSSRFGSDSSIVGRQITLDGIAFTVIGVMPKGFENVLAPADELWTPLRYNLSLPWACRTCRHLRAVARLRPGVSAAQAQRELDGIVKGLMAEHPTEYSQAGALVPPLQADVTKDVRGALLAVLVAVSLVLLIACANVTNLLLSRGAQRQGEFALRSALGAAGGRVVRQLLTESLLLATIGGALGVGVAVLGVRAVVALAPPGLPRLEAIRVDAPVLIFALTLTALVGLAFGMAPALHASRSDLNITLKQLSRRSGGTRRLTRGALVVSEVALAVVLLIGFGLLFRSMNRLLAVSPGIDPSGVLTMQVQASGLRFNNDTVTQTYFADVLDAVRRVPGVHAAALTSQLPLSGDFDGYGVHSESHPRANPEADPSAFRYAVSPGYFEAMGIPLARGRTFQASDGAGSAPVVIVNASFARREWPGEDPIGQRVRVGGASDGPWRTIVGIVGDVRQVSLAGDASDAIYVPEEQWPFADGAMSLVVRGAGDPTALVRAVRDAVWSVDKDQPIVRIATMEELVRSSAIQRRFVLLLFEVFALVALLLAAAGIYGVLAGTVAERTSEIGVRSALGATRTDIVAMVVRHGLGLAGLGLAIGLVAAGLATQTLTALLYSVSPLDTVTYVAVVAALLVVAIAACWVPAWRAARVDPMSTLRAE